MRISSTKLAAIAAVASLAVTAPAEARFGARSLGKTVSGAVGKGAGSVRTQTTRAPTGARGGGTRAAGAQAALPAGDPLEGTDAQECALDNGSSLRVSGGFRPSAASRCSE